jgi:hypothetical protein
MPTNVWKGALGKESDMVILLKVKTNQDKE